MQVVNAFFGFVFIGKISLVSVLRDRVQEEETSTGESSGQDLFKKYQPTEIHGNKKAMSKNC